MNYFCKKGGMLCTVSQIVILDVVYLEFEGCHQSSVLKLKQTKSISEFVVLGGRNLYVFNNYIVIVRLMY